MAAHSPLPEPPPQVASSRLRSTCHLPSRLPIAEHNRLLMVLVLLLKAKVSGLRAPGQLVLLPPTRAASLAARRPRLSASAGLGGGDSGPAALSRAGTWGSLGTHVG